MHKTIISGVVGLLVAVVAIGFAFSSPAPVRDAAWFDDKDIEISGLRGDVKRLASQLEETQRTVDRLVPQLAALTERLDETTAALTEVKRTSASTTVAGGSSKKEPGDHESNETVTADEKLEDALDVLFDPDISFERKQRTWSALGKAKLLDRAIAAFEDRARENPDTAQCHADLGSAYTQKIFTVNEIEKGIWAMKADGAFDKALALDERHWSARFFKAMNYSFYPPALGMQGKAIEQFEVLRRQQEEGGPEPGFEQTYIMLGNLYSNRGEHKQATAVWKKGMELFPENSSLQQRLRTTATNEAAKSQDGDGS